MARPTLPTVGGTNNGWGTLINAAINAISDAVDAVTSRASDLEADNSVTSNRIATNAVTNAKVNDVSADKLTDGSTNRVFVTSEKTKLAGLVMPYTYTYAGTLITGTGLTRLPITQNSVLVSIAVMVNTAPTGQAVIVDLNKNGATLFSNASLRPTVAAGSTYDLTPGTDASSTSLVPGDYLTIDVDQVGSSVAGADLTVIISIRPA